MKCVFWLIHFISYLYIQHNRFIAYWTYLCCLPIIYITKRSSQLKNQYFCSKNLLVINFYFLKCQQIVSWCAMRLSITNQFHRDEISIRHRAQWPIYKKILDELCSSICHSDRFTCIYTYANDLKKNFVPAYFTCIHHHACTLFLFIQDVYLFYIQWQPDQRCMLFLYSVYI